jgi:prepilin signal peptidase PulO-like enzyme (type II secretory pathway)
MILLFFLGLGLLMGSFLNVVALSLEREEGFVSRRSACPKCGNIIAWFDNIPLFSFLMLRGKCRKCAEKISWQYPAVEVVTGIIFLLVGRYFFEMSDMVAWIETVWLLGLFSVLIVIALYDARTMEIPIILLWVAGVWTFAYLLFSDFFGVSSGMNLLSLEHMASGCAAALGAWAFFASLSYVSRETWMGWGDSWLAGIIGLAVGVPDIIFALTIASGIGAMYASALILWYGKGMKTRVPFGPFLVLGAIVQILLTQIFPFGYGFFF